MNHYPHHIGDFNNATRHLTFVERALYRELLDLYYDTEQPLNADVARLARRVLANTDEQRQALQVVLEEFFVLSDSGWHNDRCDREIAAFQGKQEQQSRAGLASAAKRAGGRQAALGLTSKAKPAPRNVGGGSGSVGADDQRPLNDRSTNQNQNQNQNQSIPPNPPNGGAGADGDESQQETGEGQGGAKPDAMALATTLCAFFPEHRRIRLPEVAALLASLLVDGTVTGPVLLAAAGGQAAKHALNDGRACPSVLRWLREQRWLDSGADASATGGVDGNWSETRSGIEAMGKRVGLPPFDDSGYRLLAQYEQEVRRRLQPDEVAA